MQTTQIHSNHTTVLAGGKEEGNAVSTDDALDLP